MVANKKEPIITESKFGSDICHGCGGYTPEGNMTGNPNIKSFELKAGSNSTYVITYCNECAEKIAVFLLKAWGN